MNFTLRSGRRWLAGLAITTGLVLAVAAGGADKGGAPPKVATTAAPQPPAPIENVRVVAGDGTVTVSWSLSRTFTGSFRGIRIYRLLDAPEIRYGRPIETLVEDVGLRTSWTISALRNGQQYDLLVKAVDGNGKEFWQGLIYAYPGTAPTGAPRTPTQVYTVAGDGRVAIFWQRNCEADLALYEIRRKGPGDKEFRSVARRNRIMEITAPDSEKGEQRVPLRTITPTVWVDQKVKNGESYEYQIRAIDTEGKSSHFSPAIIATPRPPAPPSGSGIVLIVNDASDDSNGNGINDSEEVARHYAKLRGVPENQILRLPLSHNQHAIDYRRDIQEPLQVFLLANGLAGKVTTLVPCFGVPTWSNGLALDSRLADLFDRYTFGRKMGAPNPYFNSARHFDGTEGIYQVSRLDGPTVAIANSLVDKALRAERTVTATSGKGYLGTLGTKRVGDLAIRKTAEFGKWLGIEVTMKDPGEFKEHEFGPDAYWYFAWYHQYRDPIKGEWPAGAVGSHLISNSFATIREKDPARKSWVQGLLEKGITATFGAVVEPYEQGYTRPDIFFSHFWTGDYTFAESFAMATPTVQWAMSAVGDPLFRLNKGKPASTVTIPRQGIFSSGSTP